MNLEAAAKKGIEYGEASWILENNDTFFTFSYGGGFKALRLAGPVGFRFDVRGRTIPNYFGISSTRAELTGGLVFAWGER
jgi:hypothetical protein